METFQLRGSHPSTPQTCAVAEEAYALKTKMRMRHRAGSI